MQLLVWVGVSLAVLVVGKWARKGFHWTKDLKSVG
jgi:hypothetical protein